MKLESKITEDDKRSTQEKMRDARAKGWYDGIWQNVGKCVFCDLKDKYILHEENGIVLTVSLYPYIDGHLMIIPRDHVTSPKQLSQRQWETVRKFNYLAKKMMRKVYKQKSMWTLLREGGVEAQMTVSDHLHVHLIPFDKNDLCVWNYRELEYTPLENVANYRNAVKELVKVNEKYEKKYKTNQLFPLVADLLIINKKNEILLAERAENQRFSNNNFNIPGGHIDNQDNGILGELKREIREELNYEIDISKVELIESQISTVEYAGPSKYVEANLPIKHTFVWNVYMLIGFDGVEKLRPGDDSAKLHWVKIFEAENHPRLSPGVKAVIKKAIKKLKL